MTLRFYLRTGTRVKRTAPYRTHRNAYQPAMMHAKAVIADEILSIVGFANFDNRSLELNEELNIAVFDRGLAARLRADFEEDINHSVKLDLESWRARPLHIRAREKLWSLFGEVF